jgi:hypothetical protein
MLDRLGADEDCEERAPEDTEGGPDGWRGDVAVLRKRKAAVDLES